jgi:hypothetical protein
MFTEPGVALDTWRKRLVTVVSIKSENIEPVSISMCLGSTRKTWTRMSYYFWAIHKAYHCLLLEE